MSTKYYFWVFLLFVLGLASNAFATNYVYNNGGVTAPLTMTGTDSLTVEAGTFTASSGTGTIINNSGATNIQITVDPVSSATYTTSTASTNAVVSLTNSTAATVTNHGTMSVTDSASSGTFLDGAVISVAGSNNLTLSNYGTMSSNVTMSSVSGTAEAHIVRYNNGSNAYTVNINNSGAMSATALGTGGTTPLLFAITSGNPTSGTITNSGTMTATIQPGSVTSNAAGVVTISTTHANTISINNSGTMEVINNASAGSNGGTVISSTNETITISNSGTISAIANNGGGAPLAISGAVSSYNQTGAGQLTGDINITTLDCTLTHNSTNNITGNIQLGSGSTVYLNNTGGIVGNLTSTGGTLIVGNDVTVPNFTSAGTINNFSEIQVVQGTFNSGAAILGSGIALELDGGSSGGSININNDITVGDLSTDNNVNLNAGAISIGSLFVNSGTFTSSNGVTYTLSGDINNSGTAIFNGGTISAGNFINSGTFTNTTPTTFNFSGTTFTNTGTINLEFNDQNNFTVMNAPNATIDSSGGTIAVVWGGGDGSSLPGGTYTLISGTGNASVATFTQPTFTSSYIQSMLASVSGSNVILTVVLKSTSSNLVGTTTLGSNVANFLNQVSAANPTSAQSQLISNLQAITSPTVLNDDLQQLSPTVAGPIQALTLNQQHQELIKKRVNKLNLTNFYASGDNDPTYGFWMTPFFEGGKQNNNGTLLGYRANTIGVLLGFEKDINKGCSLGIAASYARSTVKSINYANTYTNIKTYLASLYGTYTLSHNLYLDLLGTGGYNSYNGQRIINVASTNATADANYNGQQYSAAAVVRKDYFYKKVHISPQVNANYVYLHQNGYSETGAGTLDYTVNTTNSSVVTLGVGFQTSRPIKSDRRIFIPQIQALVYYDVKSAAQNVTSSFVTGGPTLLTSATPGRLTGQVGANVTFRVYHRLSCEISYDLFVKNRYYNNAAFVNFTYNF